MGQMTPLPEVASTVYFRMGDDGEVLAAGGRPPALAELRPQLGLQHHEGIGYELVLALDAPVLQLVEEVDAALLSFAFLEQAIVQELPDVPFSSSVSRSLQPTDVEQDLNVPVLHFPDEDLALGDPVLDAFREAAEAETHIRMDWIEYQILARAPVSATDRAAWRRWTNRRKRRRRKRLPKTSPSHSFSLRGHAELDVGAGDLDIMFRYVMPLTHSRATRLAVCARRGNYGGCGQMVIRGRRSTTFSVRILGYSYPEENVPRSEEMNKFMIEKVSRKILGEIILKNRLPVFELVR